MEDDKDPVAIATFDSEPEAKILQIALIDRGIKATISGDVTAFGGITGGVTGVTVYVRKIEAEEARAIVREISEEENQLCPAWKCRCGATVDEGFAICWSCGAKFSEVGSQRDTE
jgi:hypothetical protein